MISDPAKMCNRSYTAGLREFCYACGLMLKSTEPSELSRCRFVIRQNINTSMDVHATVPANSNLTEVGTCEVMSHKLNV